MENNTNDGSSSLPKHDVFGVQNLVHRNIIVTVVLFLDTTAQTQNICLEYPTFSKTEFDFINS